VVINSLAIILFLIVAGAVSRKLSIFKSEDNKVFNSYLYYFALPALFFSELFRLEMDSSTFVLMLGSVLPILLILCVLLMLKLLRLLSKEVFILLSLSVAFGSYAFFGITFFDSYMGEQGLRWATFTASSLGLMGVILSLLLFEYATQKHVGMNAFLKVLTTPLFIVSVIGFASNLLGIPLYALADAFYILGKTAPGVAIFSLGMFIYDHYSLQVAFRALPLSLFRMIVLPLSTFSVLLFFPAIMNQLRIFLMLQSGIPAAIGLYVFSLRYNYKTVEITGMVITTSFLSLVSLGVLSILF